MLQNWLAIYRYSMVIRLVSIAWLITKLICYKLWLADRLFPLVPIHPLLESLPGLLHSVIFIVSLGSMIILVFFPNKKIVALLLLAEILSCVLDQNRWQPWEYQFIFMFTAYFFCNNEKQIRFTWQLIIAGLFFFSGISKLNSAFIHDVWQHLLLGRWLNISQPGTWLLRAGYTLPLIEMLTGAGLLVNKTRKISVWILAFMHLLILLVLGPFGLKMNAVIWPWNILMPLLLFNCFYYIPFYFEKAFKHQLFTWIVLLCWWVLPWLQLKGYWDKYLSSVLYGGGIEQLYICTDDKAAVKEMSVYMENKFWILPCAPVLSTYTWGMKEMNTAPYPEPRIYKAIIKEWQKRFPHNNVKFYLYKPGFAPGLKEIN